METPGLLELPHIREAVARTMRLYKAGKATGQGVGTASDYDDVEYRGDYCHIDARMDAVPNVGEATTEDPAELLEPEDRFRSTEIFLLKPREEWPSKGGLKEIMVNLGVKQGNYPRLLDRMRRSGMVEYRLEGQEVIQNLIFGVWEKSVKRKG